MKSASVIIFDALKSYDFIYDYLVPDSLDVKEGCRVMVPFGKQKNERIGFVLSLKEEEKEGLKEISSLIDFEPLLNSEGLYLVNYLHEVTFCRYFEAVKCQVPPGMGMKVSILYLAETKEDEEELNDEEKRIYHFLLKRKKGIEEKELFALLGVEKETEDIKSLVKLGFVTKGQKVRKKILDKKAVMADLLPFDEKARLTKRQEEIIDLLRASGKTSVKELCYFLGTTSGTLKKMQEKGFIELFEEILPVEASCEALKKEKIVLNEDQNEVFLSLREKLDKFSVNLLFGVTGSGKTSVFIKLIEETVKQNKSALVLIPEISLTPQTEAKFKSFFGNKVVCLNSTLSMTERLERYKLIKEGKVSIVVGTRLSVFSPLKNLGLIVIDEEQEDTYHSESSPRFDAREVGKVRAKYNNCPLLLCSATPSCETYYKAVKGSYNLFKLTKRYTGKPLPPVYMLDMLSESMQGDSNIFSQKLCQEIEYNLRHKEQTVLLLNRRGYSTKLTCVSCRNVIKCPNCSVALTYHSKNGRLICHQCGYQQKEFKKCPNCGGEMLRYGGEGTQRAEEELQSLFPEARILRMDADTTMQKNSHQKGFMDFKEGRYDIMIGTQMISKGLNFPDVTLVGILNADQALFTEDYRGFEKAFSLITQTVGRAGRGNKEGRAYIQTYSPDLDIFKFCKKEDYESFFKEEIAFREAGLYPPFCHMVKITLKCEHEMSAIEDSIYFRNIFSQRAKESYKNLPIRLLGPSEGSPYKVGGYYFMQLIIKCRMGKNLLSLLRESETEFLKNKRKSLLTIDTYYV